jgi:small ligand-binding sensory domain FIST
MAMAGFAQLTEGGWQVGRYGCRSSHYFTLRPVSNGHLSALRRGVGGQDGAMVRFGDGLAVDADLVVAAEQATRLATAPLAGAVPTLAAVFVCGGEADAAGNALQRASELTGAATVIGCTAPGVIADGRGVESETAVSVWCAAVPDLRVRGFGLEAIPADGGTAVVGLPERSGSDAVMLLLADGWSFPADSFVTQTNLRPERPLPIVGGLAVGAAGRGTTRLLLDGRIVDRGAVGVVLAGGVGMRALVSQGCRPVGPAMTVTAAEGNVVLELAGMSALRKTQEILQTLPPDEQALASEGLQLGIARDEYVDEHSQGDFLIRGIAGVDRDREALVVTDLPEVGSTVRFQVRDAAAADADLCASLRRFGRTGRGQVEGALLFSCNGRGAALFGTADHDPAVVRSELVASGVAGCFAAGEIGPVGGSNFVHAFTASLLVFGSSAAG